MAPRDQWIGWSDRERAAQLHQVVCNSLFLILPWVQVPGLASHLLAGAVRQLRGDWRAQTGRPLWLVETFVERERFAGTCYRAANWLAVGPTRGRTRNDRRHRLAAPIKELYLWPVVPDWRARLCAV